MAEAHTAERGFGSVGYSGDQYGLFGYVNDIWKVRPNLSLNLGLRYEYTDRTLKADGTSHDATFGELNPSLHVKYALTDATPSRSRRARIARCLAKAGCNSAGANAIASSIVSWWA